mmetsp:Transcript_42596/g.96886  ORF Transcript_42596/g.96886 Transcript_42596/m.96886 type:complete len:262 (-) Transcript_42596:64-849(-)
MHRGEVSRRSDNGLLHKRHLPRQREGAPSFPEILWPVRPLSFWQEGSSGGDLFAGPERHVWVSPRRKRNVRGDRSARVAAHRGCRAVESRREPDSGGALRQHGARGEAPLCGVVGARGGGHAPLEIRHSVLGARSAGGRVLGSCHRPGPGRGGCALRTRPGHSRGSDAAGGLHARLCTGADTTGRPRVCTRPRSRVPRIPPRDIRRILFAVRRGRGDVRSGVHGGERVPHPLAQAPTHRPPPPLPRPGGRILPETLLNQTS